MKINYISNLSLNSDSGGWSGLNKKVFTLLSLKADLNYVGPVDVPIIKKEWYISKLVRSVKLKSKYFFYSENRLKKISEALSGHIKDNNECIFFGSTPWIKYKPGNNYYVVTDISFKGYYLNYNKPHFLKNDINRIVKQEVDFLKNAKYVFFTSQWALRETCKYYNLDGSNFINIGIGGNIDGFWTDQRINELSFLYISQNFTQKGGNELFEAFSRYYENDKTAKLTIIGGSPSKQIIEHPGVDYIGFIDKSNLKEKDKYRQILSNSSILILPTKSDAAPLTIIECGYFGTPTIAPERFAIPEMILHNKTGFLLKNEFTSNDIYLYMQVLNKMTLEERQKMRKYTFQHFNENNNWENIINKLATCINEAQ